MHAGYTYLCAPPPTATAWPLKGLLGLWPASAVDRRLAGVAHRLSQQHRRHWGDGRGGRGAGGEGEEGREAPAHREAPFTGPNMFHFGVCVGGCECVGDMGRCGAVWRGVRKLCFTVVQCEGVRCGVCVCVGACEHTTCVWGCVCVCWCVCMLRVGVWGG